jgi:hypothetical protein
MRAGTTTVFAGRSFFRGRFMMMPPSRIGCKEVK